MSITKITGRWNSRTIISVTYTPNNPTYQQFISAISPLGFLIERFLTVTDGKVYTTMNWSPGGGNVPLSIRETSPDSQEVITSDVVIPATATNTQANWAAGAIYGRPSSLTISWNNMGYNSRVILTNYPDNTVQEKDAGNSGMYVFDNLDTDLNMGIEIANYSPEYPEIVSIVSIPFNGLPISSPVVNTPVAGDKKVTLSWEPIFGRTMFYRILYGSSPPTSTTNFQRSESVYSGLSIEIPGLENGTKYYFAVVAYGAQYQESSLSNMVESTPIEALQPPTIPSGLEITPGDKQGTLIWTAPERAVSYNVYLSTSPDLTDSDIVGITIDLSYLFANLTNGTIYYTGVSAVNSAGTSGISQTQSFITVSAIPSSPGNLTVIPDVDQFTATWDTVDNASSYNLYYARNEEMTDRLNVVRTQGGLYTAQVEPGSTYWALVKAVNSEEKESESSPTVSFTTKNVEIQRTLPPQKISDFIVASGIESASILWTPIADINNYVIYYSTDREFVKNVKSVSRKGPNTVISGLSGDTTYYFYIVGVNGQGSSPPSDVMSIRTLPKPSRIQRIKKYTRMHWKIILGVGLIILVILFLILFMRRRKASQ